MTSGPKSRQPARRVPGALAPVLALAALALAAGPAAAQEALAAVAPADPLATEPDARAPQPSGGAPALPTPGELEAMQAAIGSVAIDVDEIFDEGDPDEDNLLFRLANDLHVATRDSTVREQLLFDEGEYYSAQKAEETARRLRERGYLAEAEVVPESYDAGANTVDLRVRVRDVWTLEPGIGVGRSGGTNKARIRIADENLFGFGQKIALQYESDTDRSSLGLQFHDPNLFGSWWGLDTGYADASDGSRASLSVGRPFFSLDSRWSAGAGVQSVDQVTTLYDLGEKVNEFRSEYTGFALQGGRSRGLVDGWTRRWLAGYRYDRAQFEQTVDADTPSLAVPEDRLLSYPWVGVELVENEYRTERNRNQIGRVEDVFLGRRLLASIGWAAPALGSDRSAGIFALEGEMGLPFGEADTLLLTSAWSGRIEGGSTADAVLEAGAHYYHRFDEHNLFMTSFEGAHAHALDLDHQLQLGGDNGLRGYPLRYQTGTSRALVTVEERYFSDWYPFRLFRVGGAVFADVGRTWGDAPFASESQGLLGDAGVGLRIGNARSGGDGNVLHIDLAFPLGGPSDIDSMQLLLQAHHSF